MSRLVILTIICFLLGGCGPGQPTATTPANATSPEEIQPSTEGETPSEGSSATGDDFNLKAGDARSAHGVSKSTLKATKTEALVKFIVQNKNKEPISGIVARATGPDGDKYYSKESDAKGYAEMLVPTGKPYQITYLSLGKSPVNKTVTIPNEQHVTIKLTLTYIRLKPAPPVVVSVSPKAKPENDEPRLILEGVVFDTAKSTLKEESFPHLDRVVEYMQYKPSSRIELSGHTDNVGNPKKNKKLSEQRAKAVRTYLGSKGIDESRIEAVGYGEERPIATNDTEEGRAANRRTEAKELTN